MHYVHNRIREIKDLKSTAHKLLTLSKNMSEPKSLDRNQHP